MKKLSILLAGVCLTAALYSAGKSMDKTKPTPQNKAKTKSQQTNTKA